MLPKLRHGRWLVPLLAGALVAAGCSSGGSGGNNGGGSGTSSPAAAASPSQPTWPPAERSVDTSAANLVVPPSAVKDESRGANAGPADVTRVTQFIRSVDEAIIAARRTPVIGGSFDDAANLSLRRLIDNAPPPQTITLDESLALQRANALYGLRTAPRTAVNTVRQNWDTAVAAIRTEADRYILSTLSTDQRGFVLEVGQSVLTDISCSLLWNVMTEGYHQFANDLVNGHGYTAAFTNVMLAFWKQLKADAVETIFKAAVSGFLNRYGQQAATQYDWRNYIEGLWKHAEDLQKVNGQTAGGPTALLGYTSLCLKPPVR